MHAWNRGRADPVGAVLERPDQLSLVAQPIVDLGTGSTAGWELLSRVPAAWRVGPEQLFAAARSSGRSAPLNALVLARAAELRDRLPPDTFLTVNLDPVDLVQPPVAEFLVAHPDLERVVVELTEHDWPADLEPSLRVLDRFRERGAMIAADDLGSGFSGLSLLMQLRPHFVKIDKMFTARLGVDPAAEEVIRAIGVLSGRLDAWVVAEGVETEEQLHRLAQLDVPLAQGWFLGRPGRPWPGTAAALALARTATVRHTHGLTVGAVARSVVGHAAVGRPRPDQLSLSPETPVRDALDRALARDPACRWDDVLVTDAAGRAVQVVDVVTLVHAALREADRADDANRSARVVVPEPARPVS